MLFTYGATLFQTVSTKTVLVTRYVLLRRSKTITTAASYDLCRANFRVQKKLENVESFQETKKVKKSFKVLSTGIQCMRGVPVSRVYDDYCKPYIYWE
jgi:hypothetical protein